MSILKEIFAPHLNHNVKFGRVIPQIVGPHLRLRNYTATAHLPAPPVSLDLSPPAMSCLRDVALNNDLGDCVIAAKTHIDGVWTGNAGKLFTASDAQVLAQYEAIGGYKSGVPSTDQGCNMQDALNYWTAHPGADGTKLSAWLSVDFTNVVELKTALFLFENLDFGMALPDKWISPFPSRDGFVWDVATPDRNNGHCVPGYGYDADGVRICSWGLLGLLTFKAIASLANPTNGGELYVLVSQDMLIKGHQLAPNGLNWSQLAADANYLGANVSVTS